MSKSEEQLPYPLGGPAACEGTDRQVGPAGSRSDKRLRSVLSIEKPIHIKVSMHQGRLSAVESGWRGFLSLRDPTALTGRSGHPVPNILTNECTHAHLPDAHWSFDRVE